MRKHIFTRGKHTTITPVIFFPIIRTSFNEPTPQITIPAPKTHFSSDISRIFIVSDMYENVRKFHDFQQFRPQKSENIFLVGKTSGAIPQNFVGYRSRTLLENIIDGKTNYDFFSLFVPFLHIFCAIS